MADSGNNVDQTPRISSDEEDEVETQQANTIRHSQQGIDTEDL